MDERGWLAGAVGYEVYVRSFLDTTGDGIGDLEGVRRQLPYLADLGVEVVWLTPFFPSPQADHGYDVADYLGVDARFGDLAGLQLLLDEAHALGLRVLIDLVPNHTSDEHPWFLDARGSRDAEHRGFYVWRDPAPDGGPPNNWVSHFGGPAWTLDQPTGQYYMHLFLPQQPDLNWEDPRVHAAFDSILTTWFERGVDGVRIDVAHALVEDPSFRDNPQLQTPPADRAGPVAIFERFLHAHDLDQPGVVDVYRAWRPLADRYDAALLGEVFLLDAARLDRYLTDDALHAAFCFAALKVAWDADAIRDTLRRYVEASGRRLAWPLSSHDDPRAASRFGGGELGARRSLAYLTFLCGLPGTPFLYQGDELGLDDGVLPPGVAEDPVAVRHPGVVGRDPQRTPMPWAPGPGLGFTTGSPWLPLGTNHGEQHTVAAQRDDPGSSLERTRALLAARRRLPALTSGSSVTWLLEEGPVVAIERDDEVLVALHVGDGGGAAALVLPEGCRLAFASDDEVVLLDGELVLPEDSAAIVELEPDNEPREDELDPADRQLLAAGEEVAS